MFTLEDQNQAMCFRLEETQSVSQAGNKQHLQSPLLKLHCFKLSYARSYPAHSVTTGDLERQREAPITNQGAAKLAKNAKYHKRIKYIDLLRNQSLEGENSQSLFERIPSL